MAVYQDNEKQKAVCPICGREYSGYPATSRVDNITAICPECGTREALAAAGMDKGQQEEIISKIRETLT